MHRSNSEEDTYFQLWTKCRGWSQSKPAENAVRGTGVEISDSTRWIINFHSTSAHPPPVESKALFSTCFQESLNGIVTVGRRGGCPFCSVDLSWNIKSPSIVTQHFPHAAHNKCMRKKGQGQPFVRALFAGLRNLLVHPNVQRGFHSHRRWAFYHLGFTLHEN